MIWPIKLGTNVYISQGFGGHPEVYGQFGLKGHNGIDISCPRGTLIYAALDGDLSLEAGGSAYGNHAFIMSQAGDYRIQTVYGHLERFEGGARKVKAGELIGYADSTGFSSADHLHFGVRKWLNNGGVINNDNGYFGWIDPEPFLKGQQMRIYKDIRTNPPTVVAGFEVDTPDNLKWFANQSGVVLPLKPDGAVDFDKVTYDGQIS